MHSFSLLSLSSDQPCLLLMAPRYMEGISWLSEIYYLYLMAGKALFFVSFEWHYRCLRKVICFMWYLALSVCKEFVPANPVAHYNSTLPLFIRLWFLKLQQVKYLLKKVGQLNRYLLPPRKIAEVQQRRCVLYYSKNRES